MSPSTATMQAKAEAEEQFAEVKAALRDDVLNGETSGQLQSLGMGGGPVKATNNADHIITLYHAYDGREVTMPEYMVQDRLSRRFPSTDSSIPVEQRGKQVWFFKKPVTHDAPRPFFCLLHVNQTEEVKAEMLKAGFVGACNQASGHRTQFEADEHFRKRHPRSWKAYERYQENSRATRSNDQIQALIEAFIAKEK